ncbi:hypothetical protein DUU50_05420 [Salmonella enterica subsp. enterica serovar Corvallis]|uniref:Uncharacterized protein n=1 Tax=Salmonella enterica subsp. enterica serovar Corvallis TaxID=593905 RepID=A0A5W5L6I6_SALET|nr:hypothetical protein C7D56_10295 [Salmonella enterica subsp. enterica serovar Corvallis]EAA3387608.1 hypothetical protein [Salmonella enterica]EAC0329702.1 hypothetical protein [Salmonella enterica subsp. enterica serovar Karamoja]EAW1737339.1 hypothetical protein [Salmonella enterica subsp. enterica]EBR0434116.1 hypothetical protein [Salmonella enterica subsp. enterica serovar Vejle]EBS0851086.1 hypothetical protein [Salmonella enterica subsp. enterica serovar Carno]EBS3368812.1 hypotheti
MPAAIASFASGKAVNTVAYQAQSLQNDSAIILYYAFPQIFLDRDPFCNKSCFLYDICDQMFKSKSTFWILRSLNNKNVSAIIL